MYLYGGQLRQSGGFHVLNSCLFLNRVIVYFYGSQCLSTIILVSVSSLCHSKRCNYITFVDVDIPLY